MSQKINPRNNVEVNTFLTVLAKVEPDQDGNIRNAGVFTDISEQMARKAVSGEKEN